jgi:hypothetical protein
MKKTKTKTNKQKTRPANEHEPEQQMIALVGLVFLSILIKQSESICVGLDENSCLKSSSANECWCVNCFAIWFFFFCFRGSVGKLPVLAVQRAVSIVFGVEKTTATANVCRCHSRRQRQQTVAMLC